MGSSSEEDGNLVVKEEHMVEDVMDDDMDPWDEHPRRSAFSPYRVCHETLGAGKKPVTVLTNLQRGNIQTQTNQAEPDDFTLHNRAAMGELSAQDLRDVEVDEVDSNGFTPLMWASHYGQLPTARLLLQHRAKVNIEGEDGETALLLAASNGHHEIVKLLIGCGADPCHTDHMGNTGLMYAAHGGHSHTAHELLEHGADPTGSNLSGASAFSIAVARGSKQVQLILERSLLKLLEPS